MQKQLDLLANTDWRTLIILDACRADYYGGTPVRSPASHTKPWIRKVVGCGVLDDVVYINAQPMVDYALKQIDGKKQLAELVNVWKEHWGAYHKYSRPTVFPQIMSQATTNYIAHHGMPERLVVHFIQPHAPYIGKDGIRWKTSVKAYNSDGTLHGKFKNDCPKIKAIRSAWKRDLITTERIQQAYRGNLDLVMRAVRGLIPYLEGKVVVTADHGELLGEHGEMSHKPKWDYPELREVPWHEMDGGGMVQKFKDFDETFMDATTKEKLEALGYV